MSQNLPNLSDAIRACLPHASNEPSIPVICGVRVVSGEVWATDRYTLARAEFDCELMDDHDIFVSVATAKAILSAKSPVASIGLDDDGIGATIRLVNGQTFAIPGMSQIGDYPNVARLIPEAPPSVPADATVAHVSFMAHNLEKFGARHFPHTSAQGRKWHDLRFEFGADDTKPAVVTSPMFPWFTGVIVPVRVADWH